MKKENDELIEFFLDPSEKFAPIPQVNTDIELRNETRKLLVSGKVTNVAFCYIAMDKTTPPYHNKLDLCYVTITIEEEKEIQNEPS